MHVAFFSDQHTATLGGLQVSMALQREYLERAGHTVSVCAPNARTAPSERFRRDEDVLLAAAPVGEYSFAVAGRAADRAADRGFAQRPPVDVVHVQADFWGAWTGYRFARRHDLPVVHTMHTNVEVGLPAVMPLPGAVLRIMYAAHRHHLRCGPVRDVAGYVRTFAEAADAVVVPSSHFADRLAGYGVTRRPSIVPTGVDDDRVAALLAEPRTRRERPLMVWPGRVSREKRLDDVLAAFARSGVDADLVVYGGGADLARCRALADRLRIGDRVRFSGSVSHDTVLGAMRHADLVVQSSLGYETQGLTVYEAVALGTPVLVRDRQIARDVPGEWCQVVADGSVDALAAGMASALARPVPATDPPREFAQSLLTERLVEVYRSVLAHRATGGPTTGPGRTARPHRAQAAAPDTCTVDAAGSRTTVHGYGDPAGRAVLAVHGFRGTHIGLEPLARALAERGYRVLVPDLPATGASTPLTARHDVAGHAEWLVALSDALGAPPVLLGHSFGSVVVSAAVARGIEHRAVVLINPISVDPLEAARRGSVAVTRAFFGLARRLPERAARALIAHRLVAVLTSELMATSTDRGLRRWMRAEHVRQADMFAGSGPVLEAFDASTATTVRDHADRLRTPTLLVAGERDDMCPVRSQEQLAALIPDCSLSVLPRVGHLVHFEATEQAAVAVDGWLAEQLPPIVPGNQEPAAGAEVSRPPAARFSSGIVGPGRSAVTDRDDRGALRSGNGR